MNYFPRAASTARTLSFSKDAAISAMCSAIQPVCGPVRVRYRLVRAQMSRLKESMQVSPEDTAGQVGAANPASWGVV